MIIRFYVFMCLVCLFNVILNIGSINSHLFMATILYFYNIVCFIFWFNQLIKEIWKVTKKLS